MAKRPIKVRAKLKGQKPDMTWAQEGDVFEIDPDLFSKRWMEKITADEGKGQ